MAAEKENEVIVVPLEIYIAMQVGEILGPVNMWLAGEKLGRLPTPDEAALHYVENGGAEDFAHRHACAEVKKEEKKNNE